MTDLKTDHALLERLKAAASASLTAEELREQRVSFIIGSLGKDSSITRERVKEVLAEHEGKSEGK